MPMADLWIPTRRFKCLCVAAPKTGKTGSIAALANAGYRVIVAAFDPGYDILLNLVEPENHKNLILLPFEDRRGFQGAQSKMTVAQIGDPMSYAKFAQFLNDGRARLAPCQGGEIVELGPSESWGMDTILVIDNLTSLSKAVMARILSLQGRTRVTRVRRDWMLVADDVDDFLMQLISSFYSYHLIVLAHWKIQGPRELEDEGGRNAAKTNYTNELREMEKDLIPTKQVPVSIGRQLSANLAQHFPTCIWAEIDDQGRRVFNLEPTAVRDVGVPVKPGTLPKTLPIDSGLLTIFRAVIGAPEEVR